MKKLLILLIVVSLCMMALVGCGNKQSETEGPSQTPISQPTPTPGSDVPATDISGMQPEDYLNFDPATGTLNGFQPEIIGVTDLVIPDQIQGSDVKKIANNAFMNAGLTSVVLPSKLVEIGSNAFNDNNLETLVIPDSVSTIGINAFLKNKLTDVTLPNGLEVISPGMLRGNQLAEVVIPDSVTLIKRSAFEENLLVTIEIPASVKQIESYAFENNLLENVILHEGLERIDGHVFEKNNIESITIPKSVLYIGRAPEDASPTRTYEKFVFVFNPLKEVTLLGSNTEVCAFLMGENNFLRDAYAEGGAGRYTGSATGPWTKAD